MKSSKILLAASLWMFSLLSPIFSSNAASQLNYSFICYLNPQNNVYSTRIESANGKKNDMIYWKESYNPRKKCPEVSNKFQEFKESRRLTRLKFAKDRATNQNIVCGTAKKSDPCDNRSKIFTLLPGDDPESMVEGLREVIAGSNSPIYQGSNNDLTVSFEDLIDKIRQKQEQKR